ncbi:spondin domain-containing protein [Methylomonas rhizoryzae]|uniref:spondin domain-containing protein n=1 Tax=Methylomonas rhizoryzae TaxID=2608981 RepID=UPI0012324B7E|nr:spondin domain-containing protein [Methylomonas rhizoryzae]
MRLIQKTLWVPVLILANAIWPYPSAHAAEVTFTVTNLSAAQGVAISPVFLAFHDGSYDAFDQGSAASAAIEAVAELGDSSGLAAAFASAYADGVSGSASATVNAFGPGIFLPGGSGSITLNLDPVKNRYLSYFAMVVPSNDRFIGNDEPMEIQLFDEMGHFLGLNFVETGAGIWDAGTELDAAEGAAFLVGSNATVSPAQNGLISFDHDFSAYAGLATPGGYNFTDLPGTATPLLSISAVSQVPLPAAVWLFCSALPAVMWRRRKPAAITG